MQTEQLIAKGIVPDGVVGPLTRKLLTQPRCAVPAHRLS